MITLSFYFVNFSYAQTISSLEDEIKASKKQIEMAEEMLKEKSSLENTNLEQLNLVRSQVSNRRSIVNNMNKQKNFVTRSISNNNTVLSKLSKEHKSLIKEYSDMMVLGYKNFLFNNTLLFLFSAKDFNDLQMRIYYIRRYSNMRYQLSVDIDKKSQEITLQRDSLKIKQVELDKIVSTTKKEIESLNVSSKRYDNVLKAISKDKSNLNKQIKASQDNIKKVQKKIAEIVAEEARKERERQRKASSADKEKYSAESSHFASLKGSLLSPTENGIIVERFGKHPHPVYTTQTVNNTGLNFQVPNNSTIRAIFDGVVTKIFFVQGINNTIMVRHGDFISTYSGITNVQVQVGDVVSKGETLGIIKVDQGTPTLHFELWKGTTNINPEPWIK